MNAVIDAIGDGSCTDGSINTESAVVTNAPVTTLKPETSAPAPVPTQPSTVAPQTPVPVPTLGKPFNLYNFNFFINELNFFSCLPRQIGTCCDRKRLYIVLLVH